MTPQVRCAVLVVLKELWPDWEVLFVASPQPQVDWFHLQSLSADQVWEAFRVTSKPKGQDKTVNRLAQDLRTLV